MSTAQCKIAGAPISWGVCEVPGWGYQFPADRVLNEMREIGLARQVQSGRRTYTEAVRDGMYRPLGSGDVDVAAIVGHLRRQGYNGWYVLEQDTILTEEPRGEGPVADVHTSAEYLRSVISSSG
jgi:sugar phosphate isomerase/epimerase